MGNSETSLPIERVRNILSKEKISQVNFAKSTGVNYDTLKGVFKRKSNPTYEILRGLVILFPKYSINWVISGMGNQEIKDDFDDGTIINSGSISNARNMGKIDGHMVQISGPQNGTQKIIKEKEIVITQEDLSEGNFQHQNALLLIENRGKDALIKSLQDQIEQLKGRLADKDRIIESIQK